MFLLGGHSSPMESWQPTGVLVRYEREPTSEQIRRQTRYAVSYVVIANSNKPGNDWLPFFSKLNLMQNGKRLRDLGFSVSITRVDAN